MFIARRFTEFVRDQFSHVRIRYRTPQQLGLLERFHATLKTEEVYCRPAANSAAATADFTSVPARRRTARPAWR